MNVRRLVAWVWAGVLGTGTVLRSSRWQCASRIFQSVTSCTHICQLSRWGLRTSSLRRLHLARDSMYSSTTLVHVSSVEGYEAYRVPTRAPARIGTGEERMPRTQWRKKDRIPEYLLLLRWESERVLQMFFRRVWQSALVYLRAS